MPSMIESVPQAKMLLTIFKKIEKFLKKSVHSGCLLNFGLKTMFVYCGDYVFFTENIILTCLSVKVGYALNQEQEHQCFNYHKYFS